MIVTHTWSAITKIEPMPWDNGKAQPFDIEEWTRRKKVGPYEVLGELRAAIGAADYAFKELDKEYFMTNMAKAKDLLETLILHEAEAAS